MGYYDRRINKAVKTAGIIYGSEQTRIVFFSDCHRGDGSWSDSFLHNKILYQAALDYYWINGFTYVEVGDGDELWENRSFQRISEVHGDIFRSLRRFAASGRLHMIAGNHDKVKLKKGWPPAMGYGLHPCPCREAVIIHLPENHELFAIHGHQADFFNDKLWPLARFMVRYLWRPLELSGFKDPTSAARNYKKGSAVEKRLMDWAERNKINVISGHTHRPAMKKAGTVNYINTGSCVHPNGITCVELRDGKAGLIKWTQCVDENRRIYVCRQSLA